MLQQRIDAAEGCDAVLLGYGLCGRATDGLTARNRPVVLPRSHDCCGILLGSRKRFEELFRDMPSTPFSSVGYIEHGEYYFADGEMMFGDSYAALVEQYGEDNARHSVTVNGTHIDLTYKEYSLLRLLLENTNLVVTRETILQVVWGTDISVESRTVDMHIRTLRKKLGDAGRYICTVRKVGYKLADNEEGEEE